MVGAARSEPGLQVPANLKRRRGTCNRLLELEVEKLSSVAARAFDPHPGTIFNWRRTCC